MTILSDKFIELNFAKDTDVHRLMSELHSTNTIVFSKLFKIHCNLLVDRICKEYPQATINEAIYCFMNEITPPHCKYCGNRLRFITMTKGFSSNCAKSACRILDPSIRTKMESTNMQLYGTVNAATSDTIKKKISVSYESKSDDEKRNINQKRKLTNRLKYDVDFVFQNHEIKEKIRTTNIERYGVDNPSKCDSVKEKRINTFIRHYGVDNPSKDDSIKEKIVSTLTNNYGPDYKKIIVKKSYTTMVDKYGHYSPANINISHDTFNFLNDKDSVAEGVTQVGVAALAKKYGISEWCIYTYITFHGLKNLTTKSRSWGEQELEDWIRSLGIETLHSDRSILSGRELDIYLPVNKLAIEYNGLFWHSELNGKGSDYHLSKTDRCAELGIHLIHIFDIEWNSPIKQNIIKSRIKSYLGLNDTVYARKTLIKVIDRKIAQKFLNESHMQGSCNSSVYLGLVHDNLLVSVMSFAKSRYNKNFDFELVRFVTTPGINVVGGASKLLNYFTKEHPTSSIISYADRRWSKIDSLYNSIGFEYAATSNPNYFYTNNYTTLESRLKYQKHKLASILPTFDSTKTEWENMQINGYDRIWDCGSFVYTRAPK